MREIWWVVVWMLCLCDLEPIDHLSAVERSYVNMIIHHLYPVTLHVVFLYSMPAVAKYAALSNMWMV